VVTTDSDSKKPEKPASGKIVLSNKKAKCHDEPQIANKAELEKTVRTFMAIR